ncbi:MAG: sugar transferase [Desulfosarcina sp.]|nr:sugar transferase [Desulfosarcina sp.]MBC2764907.1 sugar transferase [Desulfosarcina sp.]
MSHQSTKRGLDLVLSGLVFSILAPLIAVIAVVVWVFIGKPVFFRQTRPGLHGNPFNMYKFRTMTDGLDGNGNLLPDAQRLTRLGRFLRSASLDELPELINVIKGEMSLVGQVNGRNAITWEEKFKLDVWYIDNCSIALDLKIIAMTVLRVIMREGINAYGEATMHEFKGSKP